MSDREDALKAAGITLAIFAWIGGLIAGLIEGFVIWGTK
jgi:uncharacterized membrane protein YagU involved in acid resistance